MGTIDFTKLSQEEKAELRRQMEAEDRERIERGKKIREDYDKLKDEQVKATFKSLQTISSSLESQKVDIFEQFGALLKMKQEVYALSNEQIENQQSHTFTSEDGRMSIIIGHNIIDRWSDEVNIGVDRVKKWIENSIIDGKTQDLFRSLLKPNTAGMLKANRILDLAREAAKHNDKELIEAVDFIRDQYKPERTSTFVKAKYLDENQQWQWLALSMSAV